MRWQQWKGNNKREDAKTAFRRVCLSVCQFPAQGCETLGNPSGRWTVKNNTTSSCCSLPTFIVLFSLPADSDILASYLYFIIQKLQVHYSEQKMNNWLQIVTWCAANTENVNISKQAA